MDKSKKTRQKIYDRWHKTVYQVDIKKSVKSFSFLHKTALNLLRITDHTRGKLLDVACGKGLLLKEIRERNKHIRLYGSDISEYAINAARKIVPTAIFSVDDGEDLSFNSNQFDFISCLGGLEYYDNPTRGASEIARVLKRNGIAVIFVPNLMFAGYIWLALRYGIMPTHGGTDKNGEQIYDYNDEKFYTYQGWREILEKGGLKIASVNVYSYLGSTRFAHPWLLKPYNTFFYKLIPFNLSYSFIFVCTKS
ncbi:hypothetical protein A3F29_00205 [Candidatus Roizmanbacteria bacterium RIFCSPHIGHO2_12_FULL_33_9]|uniref:Methyltransferase type 11 domain-containing protein n=1 Tax=Candidatus Roizmanbacteria bacterium RIFCSPHIGHO2_12_FULL_33_9 TaxID=1802045 RepID=A0A1F7HI52_9BACT|nr:MAG: hypothetical protein A3F29_00205 [Candidatus Roizmanbacteria bacterium RIFCSPHIGHO2_12_FULL_33_9]